MEKNYRETVLLWQVSESNQEMISKPVFDRTTPEIERKKGSNDAEVMLGYLYAACVTRKTRSCKVLRLYLSFVKLKMNVW